MKARPLVLLAVAAAALVLARKLNVGAALDSLRGLGPWAPLAFIALYVAAALFLLPGSVLTLGAGAVFGVVMGTVWASIAATLGATAAFLTGRYLAKDWTERRLASQPRFKAVSAAVAREGLKIVLLLRLSPLIPFNVLNYALGVTRVSLRHYILGSWLGMLPGTVMYVYLGAVAGDLAGGRQRTKAEWALYAAGLAATVAVAVYVARLAKGATRSHV